MTEQEKIDRAMETLEPIARTATIYKVADALNVALAAMREKRKRLENPGAVSDGYHVPIFERAPEWDGHTPNMALDRILSLPRATGRESQAMSDVLEKCVDPDTLSCQIRDMAETADTARGERVLNDAADIIADINDRHWNECWQIAQYDDELRRAWEIIDSLHIRIRELTGEIRTLLQSKELDGQAHNRIRAERDSLLREIRREIRGTLRHAPAGGCGFIGGETPDAEKTGSLQSLISANADQAEKLAYAQSRIRELEKYMTKGEE